MMNLFFLEIKNISIVRKKLLKNLEEREKYMYTHFLRINTKKTRKVLLVHQII